MSEQVRQQVKPQLLRYKLQTEPGLSAEEAELYLLAVIDDVCLACLLAALSQRAGSAAQDGPPHTDLVAYRQNIAILSISYQNPWELVFEVLGTAGVVATAIQTMYNLRSSRRKTEAETEKIRAETQKLTAETRNLSAAKEIQNRAPFLKGDELLALFLVQKAAAVRVVSTERQERPVRELLAEAALKGRDNLDDIKDGLNFLKDDLAREIDQTIALLDGGRARNEQGWMESAQLVADNTRLIASIQRLESVERTVEAIDGNDPA